MKRITIIGGGASGTLLAANLLRSAGDRSLEIDLVEERPLIGRGVAYSTTHDVHLLNVPAAKMGAFPDDIGHFHSWLQEHGYNYGPTDFVSRRIFGNYLSNVFEKARDDRPSNVRINVFEDEVVDIAAEDNKAKAILASGDHIFSEAVVFAFGNFLPPHPSVKDTEYTKHPKYFRSPWNKGVFDSIPADDAVLIIGTGLSMVDVVLKLNEAGHSGKIYAISTRGLLPAVHKLGDTYPSFADEIIQHERISDILRIVRRHIAKAEEQGIDWRAVIDSLRPATQQMWLNLPTAEKRYFMQHLSRYWNVARHRMPEKAAQILNALKDKVQLEILKGRLSYIKSGDKFSVGYRCDGLAKDVSANVMINCIGSESNFSRVDSTLVKNLLSKGYIRTDELNMGLDALPNGAIVGQNGDVSNIFYTLGTALKGRLWETTAIPEIRAQARELSTLLLAD